MHNTYAIRYLTLIVASTCAAASGLAADYPATWLEYKYSTNPINKKAAQTIEQEAKDIYRRTCTEWGKGLRAKQETLLQAARHAFLIDGDYINGLDIGHARERRLTTGMTICGVFAAYGLPNKVNTTEQSGHFSAQIIYRERDTYVYVESARKGTLIVKTIQR